MELMCRDEDCREFTHIANEIEGLKYTSEPNYSKLRKMMDDLFMFEQNLEF